MNCGGIPLPSRTESTVNEGTLTLSQKLRGPPDRRRESPVQFLLNHGPRRSGACDGASHDSDDRISEAFAIGDVRSVDDDAILISDTARVLNELADLPAAWRDARIRRCRCVRDRTWHPGPRR